jgi:hypothetical protein
MMTQQEAKDRNRKFIDNTLPHFEEQDGLISLVIGIPRSDTDPDSADKNDSGALFVAVPANFNAIERAAMFHEVAEFLHEEAHRLIDGDSDPDITTIGFSGHDTDSVS